MSRLANRFFCWDDDGKGKNTFGRRGLWSLNDASTPARDSTTTTASIRTIYADPETRLPNGDRGVGKSDWVLSLLSMSSSSSSSSPLRHHSRRRPTQFPGSSLLPLLPLPLLNFSAPFVVPATGHCHHHRGAARTKFLVQRSLPPPLFFPLSSKDALDIRTL